jgi:AraC-like DNA-binding protein
LTLIAYFLYPHALKTLFRFDANELTGLGIDLNLLSPAREMNIQEQLLNAASLDIRLQIMNQYISGLSQAKGAIINQAILFAAKTIRESGGLVSLQKLQKEVYISERNFRRLFEFHIGVSPKTFGRICQFDAAFRQLNQNSFSRLSDIAFDNGYADQSHLIRSFREFTSYSPREYVKNTGEFQLLNP